jgi:hypothetical protein
MQRVAVVGAGGAGRTAFALALGHRLGLPVVHPDSLCYGPGWEPAAPADWECCNADLWLRIAGSSRQR